MTNIGLFKSQHKFSKHDYELAFKPENSDLLIEKLGCHFRKLQLLLNVLEPDRLRNLFTPSHHLETLLAHHSYLQGALCWRTSILRMAPELRDVYQTFERYYQLINRSLFYIHDFMDLRKNQHLAMDFFMFLYDDVVRLKALDTDPSAVDALVSILESQIRLLLARYICSNKFQEYFNSPKTNIAGPVWCARIKSTPKIFCRESDDIDIVLRMQLISSLPGGRACIPSNYPDQRLLMIGDRIPLPAYPRCLKSKESTDTGPNKLPSLSDIANCCCGRAIACIPDGLLEYFGHNHESLSRHLHDSTYKTKHGPLLEVFIRLLGTPHAEEPFSHKDIPFIFRQALSWSVRAVYQSIECEASDNPCPAHLKLGSLDSMVVFILALGTAICDDLLRVYGRSGSLGFTTFGENMAMAECLLYMRLLIEKQDHFCVYTAVSKCFSRN